MTTRPTLVVFLGDSGGGSSERVVGEARIAASLDCVEAALACGAYAGAVLATDDPSLSPGFPGLTADVDSGRFHFGRRLAGVLRDHAIRSAVYLGGGAVPLFGPEDFASLADAVAAGRAVTNNIYSSDLAAFPVTEDALHAIESVERDNALARALAERADMEVEEMPRTYVTQLDIDSPTDLAVLSLTGLGGARLRRCLDASNLDSGVYRQVLPLFLDSRAQIVVAGRVGSRAWQYLERETACRVRLFAEERGMEAEGRGAGAARSLLGFYLGEVGFQRFFDTLAQLGDAAFLDTRVLLAHEGIEAGREDRFLSDLRCWQDIREPFLRELTRAAAGAPVPVLLGGHSLMSGGLMALNEFAWRQRDAGSI
jgi:hypothetical protein